MVFADAHIHISQIKDWSPVLHNDDVSPVCSCAHSPNEWIELSNFAKDMQKKVVISFGIHPQNPNTAYVKKLEDILEKKLFTPKCIGEAGFDLFTEEYAKTLPAQIEVWNAQLEFSEKYKLPLIVHCRHALDKIFADSKKLSKIPSVIFHSFPGSPQEAQSIINRNINAFFSLGKPILNGNKRALKCAQELPLALLLAETDAPYQTLKGEAVTPPSDIIKVYKKIAELRNIPLLEVCNSLENNFQNAFNVLK